MHDAQQPEDLVGEGGPPTVPKEVWQPAGGLGRSGHGASSSSVAVGSVHAAAAQPWRFAATNVALPGMSVGHPDARPW